MCRLSGKNADIYLSAFLFKKTLFYKKNFEKNIDIIVRLCYNIVTVKEDNKSKTEGQRKMKVYIKEWFFNKNWCSIIRNYMLNERAVYVIDETEKAYKVEGGFTTQDGERENTFDFWVPKSCTMTEEEYAAEQKAFAERQEEIEKHFKEGCEAYEALLKFAKENNVKDVRKGMKKETILNKIHDAGLEYNA